MPAKSSKRNKFRLAQEAQEAPPPKEELSGGSSTSDDSEDNESSDQELEEPIAELKAASLNDGAKKSQQVQQSKWTDRERVMILCSRGSLARTRHLMNDLKRLMPHTHSESKLDKSAKLETLNEMAELVHCTKCLYFESRKGRDVYLWASNVGGGPSVKFLVHNIHTMNELNLSGNCLKGSRPILSFDSQFDSQPHLQLIKEVFKHTFKTPNYHPRSQPFIDHVVNFSILPDGKIWFRNYQIVDENLEMQEIGPRMVLEIVRIFDDSFRGTVLYDNPNYQTPNAIRRAMKLKNASKYDNRVAQKESVKVKDEFIRNVKVEDPVGEVFDTDKEIVGKQAYLLNKELHRVNRKKSKAKKPKLDNVA